jgi:hypothetical protein
MPRKSPSSVDVNPYVRCQRIYPVEGSHRTIADLQTVGFKLSREQAIHLARVLLAVTQDWDEIEVTGYRMEPSKSDGTYRITVTSNRNTPSTEEAAQA